MNIAIIGTGNIGATLARAWARKGHNIILGVRDTNNFKGAALLAESNITALSIQEAVTTAEVILIAAVPQATADIVAQMGNVSGKVIIDAMNSVRTRPEGYNNSFDAFVALCPGAEVVKCFNCTGFENLADPVYPNNMPIDMFAAGDSKHGKEIATQLSLDAGFGACYNFGGNDKAALLEQFALVWINLAIMQGHGRGIAFKVVKR